MNTDKPDSIDSYINSFPADTQKILQEIRQTIREAAPEASEAIKYAIPTFVLNGNLVHFAAFKNHIGFYPTPSGTDAFADELSAFKSGKGSVQFPLSQPIPLDLIKRIVQYRMKQQQSTKKAKK